MRVPTRYCTLCMQSAECKDSQARSIEACRRSMSAFPRPRTVHVQYLGHAHVSAFRNSQVSAFSNTRTHHIVHKFVGTVASCPHLPGVRFSQVSARTGLTVQDVYQAHQDVYQAHPYYLLFTPFRKRKSGGRILSTGATRPKGTKLKRIEVIHCIKGTRMHGYRQDCTGKCSGPESSS